MLLTVLTPSFVKTSRFNGAAEVVDGADGSAFGSEVDGRGVITLRCLWYVAQVHHDVVRLTAKRESFLLSAEYF